MQGPLWKKVEPVRPCCKIQREGSCSRTGCVSLTRSVMTYSVYLSCQMCCAMLLCGLRTERGVQPILVRSVNRLFVLFVLLCGLRTERGVQLISVRSVNRHFVLFGSCAEEFQNRVEKCKGLSFFDSVHQQFLRSYHMWRRGNKPRTRQEFHPETTLQWP